MKTLVSISTNTEETWDVHGCLDKIKPLLKNASVKISSNSLITSLIENIPKVTNKRKMYTQYSSEEEHGENKTIVYLDKNRSPTVTCNAYVQTENNWYIDNVDKNYSSEDDGRFSRSSTHSRSTSRSSMSPSSR